MKIFQVDSFTDRAFSGNPAAVCILLKPGIDEWMQNVASEMNLSETAFIYKQRDNYNLRWFTPTVEVELCGHATLASAHILWEMEYEKKDRPIQFETRSGVLTATTNGKWIELNFPADPPVNIFPPHNLLKALGVEPIYVGKNRFDYIVQLGSEEEVKRITPDFNLLARVACRGVIITSIASSKEYDFVSRFFAPAAGINEDPVTGSAHCCLAPFWKEKLNKEEFKAYQASKRGGFLKVRAAGNRTYIAGQAVTVFKGDVANTI